MKIKLNNRKEEFGANRFTIEELLAIKKFTFKMLVVKINGKLIKKEDYDTTLISDGDEVHIIHLISGG